MPAGGGPGEDPADLFDAGGNIREGIARQRDAPAGFAPDVLATFDREPELVDVAALHLLERHFAPGLHEEILEAVGLELGTPVTIRRRAGGFRAAVLEAYLAECCSCVSVRSGRRLGDLTGVIRLQQQFWGQRPTAVSWCRNRDSRAATASDKLAVTMFDTHRGPRQDLAP